MAQQIVIDSGMIDPGWMLSLIAPFEGDGDIEPKQRL